MKVLVCGGRKYANATRVNSTMDDLQRRFCGLISHVITGGATGADRLAEEWAVKRGVQPVLCPANWPLFGKGAGPRRNSAMVPLLSKSNADDKGLETEDFVVAFPGGDGTADMVARARAAGFTVIEVT